MLCLSLQKYYDRDAVLSLSKELIVFSRYTGMSGRQSEPLDSCGTRFKGWMGAKISCNIRIVAKNLLDYIPWKILSSSGSFLSFIQIESADK